MERYKNLGGDSGIVGYTIAQTSITVQFRDGGTYLYNHQITGKANVEQMKQLASAGQGLNSYISRVVRKRYAEKIR